MATTYVPVSERIYCESCETWHHVDTVDNEKCPTCKDDTKLCDWCSDTFVLTDVDNCEAC